MTAMVLRYDAATDEAACLEFCLRHPGRLRVMRRVLGWDLRSEKAVREFVQTHPFVAFRPAPGSAARSTR